MGLWSFSCLVSPARQSHLLAATDFQQIAQNVARNIYEIRPELERAPAPQLRDWARPVFRVRTPRAVADAFFNSPFGYRGAYCESQNAGRCANEYAISLLIDVLRSAAMKDSNLAGLDTWVSKSLSASAAKTWVWESQLAGFPWRDLVTEVQYGPWIKAADEWLKDKVDMPQLQGGSRNRWDDRLPFWGVRAPETEWLEVKGAWMVGDVPQGTLKPNRGQQIADWGWT
jgi:hypothetical protein